MHAFYKHFPAKTELLAFLVELGYEELAREMELEAGAGTGALARLEASVRVLHRACAPSPSRRRTALRRVHDQLQLADPGALVDAQGRLLGVLTRQVSAALPGRRDAARRALLVLRVVHQVAAVDDAADAGARTTEDEVWAAIVQLVLRPAA